MTPDEITGKINHLVAKQVDAAHYRDNAEPAILPHRTLYALGLDELATIEILMHIEEAFGIELADDDITLSSTIDGIARLVAWALRQREEQKARAPTVREAW